MATRITKAEFLEQPGEWLQKIAASGESIVLMDDGSPVAELRPIRPKHYLPDDTLHGTVLYQGDLISPIEPDGYKPFK